MRRLGPAQSLDRRDRFFLHRPQRHIARCEGVSLYQHKAGAALLGAAAEARTLEPKGIAQHVEQRRLAVRFERVFGAVDPKGETLGFDAAHRSGLVPEIFTAFLSAIVAYLPAADTRLRARRFEFLVIAEAGR